MRTALFSSISMMFLLLCHSDKSIGQEQSPFSKTDKKPEIWQRPSTLAPDAADTASDSTKKVSRNLVPKRFVFVYAEPIALIDFWNGESYRAGAEFAFSPDWSIYGTFGGYFEQGYFLRSGIRRTIAIEDNEKYSLGLEFINSWHIHRTTDYYKDATGNAPDYSRPLYLMSTKNISALTLTFSYQEFMRHSWVIEWFGGIGVRYRKAIFNHTMAETDNLYHWHEGDSEATSFYPGENYTLDLRFGMRIGHLFW